MSSRRVRAAGVQRRQRRSTTTDLTNRDLALGIWAAAAFVALFANATIRKSIRDLAGAFLPFLPWVVAFALWYAGVVLIAARFGAWTTTVLKDTIAWFAVPGLVLLFSFPRTYEDRTYYRTTIRKLVAGTVLVEFYLNLVAYPLVIELVLLPLVVFVAVMSTFSEGQPEYAQVHTLMRRLLVMIGLIVLITSTVQLWNTRLTLDAYELLQTFVLPVWSTLLCLPFVFAFGLYAAYQWAFVRVDLAAPDDRRGRWRAKAAILTTLGIHSRSLHDVRLDARALVEAKSFAAARRALSTQVGSISPATATNYLDDDVAA